MARGKRPSVGVVAAHPYRTSGHRSILSDSASVFSTGCMVLGHPLGAYSVPAHGVSTIGTYGHPSCHVLCATHRYKMNPKGLCPQGAHWPVGETERPPAWALTLRAETSRKYSESSKEDTTILCAGMGTLGQTLTNWTTY